jgi:hypothetical protein
VALLASTVMLSGCIGAFEEQPKRYNFVAGAKRPPMLNPGGIGNQAAVDAAQIAPVATQAAMQPAPAEMSAMQPVTNAAAAPMEGATGAEPSPLYYYEQQNAGVNASELSATSSGQPTEVALPAPAENAEYPTLQSVQQPSPELQKSFDDAKARAQAFEAANPVPPSAEMHMQQSAMMGMDVSQQPIQVPAAEQITQETTLADIPAQTIPLPAPAQMPAPAPQFEGVSITPEPSPLASMPPTAMEPAPDALAPTPTAPAVAASVPVYDPAQHTVEVPQAEPVATSPMIQSSDPIRLARPAYSSRVREIPPSRYSRVRTRPLP